MPKTPFMNRQEKTKNLNSKYFLRPSKRFTGKLIKQTHTNPINKAAWLAPELVSDKPTFNNTQQNKNKVHKITNH